MKNAKISVQLKNESNIAAVAMVLMLTVSALIASLPAASAQKQETTAYLSIRPNPIGIYQELLINAWTVPTPPLNTSDPIFPGLKFYAGETRHDNMLYFTDPDGNTEALGPFDAYGEGTFWAVFVPDQVGEWTVRYTWPGDDNFEAASTQTTLVVQQDPIPSWPPAPLPTGPWNYPITPENREWADIAGGYWEPTTGTGRGYDSSGSRFNPYTRAPNSAHILWKLPPISGLSGLVGQPYGQTAFFTAGAAAVNVVMCGRGYYQAGGMIHCIDINTGEELWAVPGSYTLGVMEVTPPFEFLPASFQPVLWYFGERIIKYDALTGAILLDSEGLPGEFPYNFAGLGGYTAYQQPYAYFFVPQGTAAEGGLVNLTQGYQLLKVDTSGPATNIADRIVWNVTYPTSGADHGTCLIDNTLVIIFFDDYGDAAGIDLDTGDILWHHPLDDIEQKPEGVTSGYGMVYHCVRNRMFTAINARTGVTEWFSEQAEYPWGNFWAYGQSVAYDQVYGLSYAGVYAFNASTGKINWHYQALPPDDYYMETPYNQFPFGHTDPIVADGKVFAPNSEHTPTFYYRGFRLHAINAYNGDPVWSIMGYYGLGAIAQDKLFATNEYDGCSYCFGKGETATTVSSPSKVVAKGSSVLIEGTVMDLSPAQPNTPAISDASMSDWMEYLHMQRPFPMDAEGVSVTLNALDPNGDFIDIGTATSNTDGKYGFTWTPEQEGMYEIIATFEGSESYYASHDTTVIGVGPEPSPYPEYPEATTEGVRAIELATIAVVIVAVVIGIVNLWALRKRK